MSHEPQEQTLVDLGTAKETIEQRLYELSLYSHPSCEVHITTLQEVADCIDNATSTINHVGSATHSPQRRGTPWQPQKNSEPQSAS